MLITSPNTLIDVLVRLVTLHEVTRLPASNVNASNNEADWFDSPLVV